MIIIFFICLLMSSIYIEDIFQNLKMIFHTMKNQANQKTFQVGDGPFRSMTVVYIKKGHIKTPIVNILFLLLHFSILFIPLYTCLYLGKYGIPTIIGSFPEIIILNLISNRLLFNRSISSSRISNFIGDLTKDYSYEDVIASLWIANVIYPFIIVSVLLILSYFSIRENCWSIACLLPIVMVLPITLVISFHITKSKK